MNEIIIITINVRQLFILNHFSCLFSIFHYFSISVSDYDSSNSSNRRCKKGQRKRSIDQDSFDSTSTYPERNRRFFYDEIEEEELAETQVLAQQINKLGLENRCLDDTMIKYTLNNTFQTNLLSNRRAPLASISSLKMSSIDYQDSSLKSPISDSIFEETYADTDDDMDQFSTDSDVVAIHEMHEKIESNLPHSSSTKSRKFDSKAIVCIEHIGDLDVATTSAFAHDNREIICDINEIGPQILKFPLKHSNQQAAITYSSNINENTKKLLHLESSCYSGNNNNNKYSKSTGNMAQADTQQIHDKNQFLSEPVGLNLRTSISEEPSKLHKINSKTIINTLRMPSKTSYSSSSNQSSSSSNTTT